MCGEVEEIEEGRCTSRFQKLQSPRRKGVVEPECGRSRLWRAYSSISGVRKESWLSREEGTVFAPAVDNMRDDRRGLL